MKPRTKTHREAFPEQYTHPLCGKQVRVKSEPGTTGTVERVVKSERWGELACLSDQGLVFWKIADLELIGETK